MLHFDLEDELEDAQCNYGLEDELQGRGYRLGMDTVMCQLEEQAGGTTLLSAHCSVIPHLAQLHQEGQPVEPHWQQRAVGAVVCAA
jgi:hypothetical protein